MMRGGNVRDRDGQRMPIGESIDEATAKVRTQEAGEARSAVVAGALATAFTTIGDLGCLHMRRLID